MAKTRLSVAVNLDILAPSQYLNYNFNSYCKIGDKYIAANEDGLFQLDVTQKDESSSDSKAAIEAYYESGPTDFGVKTEKRVRKAVAAIETDGPVELVVRVAEGTSNEVSVQKVPMFDDNREHIVDLPVGRELKGRFFSWGIKNVQGADFSLDELVGFVEILIRKPEKRGAN